MPVLLQLMYATREDLGAMVPDPYLITEDWKITPLAELGHGATSYVFRVRANNDNDHVFKVYKKKYKCDDEARIMNAIQDKKADGRYWDRVCVPSYKGTISGSILMWPVLFQFRYRHWALSKLTTAITKLVDTLWIVHTELRLLHTDIRPANIMQNGKSDKLYLIDWGFAQRMTEDNNNIPIPGNHTFMSISVLQQCLEHSFNGTLKYGVADDLCSLIQVILCLVNPNLKRAIYGAQDDETLLKYWKTVVGHHKNLFDAAQDGNYTDVIAELKRETWCGCIVYKL